jgi:ligand-binding sensor domain-containing protein
MVLKTILSILLFVSWTLPHWSQSQSSLWTGYFSFYDIKTLSANSAKVYACADNVLFSYDPSTNQSQEITTINGLSGESISAVHLSKSFELLVIGYGNGLIEIYDETTDDVLKVVDVLNKTTIPPNKKKINHFYEFESRLYIATDYGVSVFDLVTLEFGDSYFIGDNGGQVGVNQTTVFNNTIYAITALGIKTANVDDDNLIDHQVWSNAFNGNYSAVVSTTNQLYVLDRSNKIYEMSSRGLTLLFTYPSTVQDIKITNTGLVISTTDKIYIYQTDFTPVATLSLPPDYNTTISSAIQFNGDTYIGTTSAGVLKTSLINSNNFDEIHPKGPLENNAFSIEYNYGNLWVTFGEYTIDYNSFPRKRQGISNLSEDLWKNIPYDSLKTSVGTEIYNLNAVSINPLNPNQVLISSFESGLLDLVKDESLTLLNETNSGLESLFDSRTPNYKSIRVSGSTFDDQTNLWLMNAKINRPLKKYNPDTGQWQDFDFTSIIDNGFSDENGFSEIVIGPDGTKWIGGHNFGLIGFNENGNQLKNIKDKEIANLPSTGVKALAMDNNNSLWIGTYRGLRVLYNTSNFFEDETARVESIIILEDGLPKELLELQFITDIIVDGSNNKWVSTIGAGVFYLSSNGQNTIYHFTETNSPLPSNNVNDMAIDSTNGMLFFATDRGLVSFNSGGSSTSETLDSVFIYPNPVRPGFNMNNSKIKIKNLSDDVNIKITDIEGNLVAEAQSNINLRFKNYNLEIDGGTAYWNGKNLTNTTVASGVYVVLISNLDTFETTAQKIMIVR